MDISKCENATCPIRKKCIRFTVKPNEYRQAYGQFKYEINEQGETKCDYFWDNKGYRK